MKKGVAYDILFYLRRALSYRREAIMSDKRTDEILALLDEKYGTEAICYLKHDTPEQLLIATMLSAQCTDARVNVVTENLFKKYPDMNAFSKAKQSELEKDIYQAGLYHSKAKNIIACAKILCEKYDGHVPNTLKELTSLPGVGRKTANVIMGNVFHTPSIVVDTHVKRISNRLGFTKMDDPVKVELELMEVLPEDHWILYNMQIITFGRDICTARKPKCDECFLTEYCMEYKNR